jgi:hypothetical protein
MGEFLAVLTKSRSQNPPALTENRFAFGLYQVDKESIIKESPSALAVPAPSTDRQSLDSF